MKFSIANPVSTWMGERLTLPGAVDFSCFFFFFFFVCFFPLFLFSHYSVIHSNNSVCICSADAFSYDMIRICLPCTLEDSKKKLYKEKVVSRRIRRGSGSSVELPYPTIDSKFHFHGKLWISIGYRIYPKYQHPLLFTLYFSSSPFDNLRVRLCKLLDE